IIRIEAGFSRSSWRRRGTRIMAAMRSPDHHQRSYVENRGATVEDKLEPKDLHLALDSWVGGMVPGVGQSPPGLPREGDRPHDRSTGCRSQVGPSLQVKPVDTRLQFVPGPDAPGITPSVTGLVTAEDPALASPERVEDIGFHSKASVIRDSEDVF